HFQQQRSRLCAPRRTPSACGSRADRPGAAAGGFLPLGITRPMNSEPSNKPGAWTRIRHWLGGRHFRLVTIEDTPHSIALGVAIGIFFGFTPLWSLKTLLSIAVAWLFKSNKIAAAISV